MAWGATWGWLCHLTASTASPQIPRLDGEYDLKVPRDMAYVFSGAYTPLSCKLMEQVGPGRGGAGTEHPGGSQPSLGPPLPPAACRP